MWKIYVDWNKSNADYATLKVSCRDDGFLRRYTVSWISKKQRFANGKDWLLIRGLDGAEAEAANVAREVCKAKELLKFEVLK